MSWYVVTVIATGHKQVLQPPIDDRKYTVDSGPYATKAEAESHMGSGGLDQATIDGVVTYAKQSVGHQYAWGGVPGPFALGPWDCSSACNYWWGVVGNQAIPDFPHGSYDGTVHGPSTIGWLLSQGTVTGSIHRSLASAGDLAVWRTHMGLCISNTEMVSAQNPASGTQISGIDGFIQGEPLTILRLAVVGPGGVTLPFPAIGGAHSIERSTRQIAQMTRELVAARMRLQRLSGNRWQA